MEKGNKFCVSIILWPNFSLFCLFRAVSPRTRKFTACLFRTEGLFSLSMLYMSAYVLMNLLNELRKMDKLQVSAKHFIAFMK